MVYYPTIRPMLPLAEYSTYKDTQHSKQPVYNEISTDVLGEMLSIIYKCYCVNH